MRSGAPQGVLVWSRAASWTTDVGDYLLTKLRPGTISRWQQDPHLKNLYDDDSEWRIVLIDALEQDYCELKHEFALFLKKLNIRMYHCCRPTNPSTYAEYGFKRSSKAHRQTALVDAMNDLGLPSAEREQILASAREKQKSHDTELGTVFFALDERYLTEHAGHYLLWVANGWRPNSVGFIIPVCRDAAYQRCSRDTAF